MVVFAGLGEGQGGRAGVATGPAADVRAARKDFGGGLLSAALRNLSTSGRRSWRSGLRRCVGGGGSGWRAGAVLGSISLLVLGLLVRARTARQPAVSVPRFVSPFPNLSA